MPTLNDLVDDWWKHSHLYAETHAFAIDYVDSEAHMARLRDYRSQIAAAPTASQTDRDTQALAIERIDAEIALSGCEYEYWLVPPLPVLVAIRSPDPSAVSREETLQQYEGAADRIAQMTTNLRAGLAEGKVTDKATIVARVAEIDDALRAPGVFLGPTIPFATMWTMDERRAYEQRIDTAEPGLDAAVRAWRAFLVDEVFPSAREQAGTGAPGGRACYTAAIRWAIGEDLTVDQVDAIANEHMKASKAAVLAWGASHDLPTLADLRRETTAGYSSPDLMLVDAQSLEVAALAKLAGAWPKTPLEPPPVRTWPATCIGMASPTQVWLTPDPTRLPKNQLPAVMFHEGVPGHVFQAAFARLTPGTPRLRREAYIPAYTEGWGLYSEGLADEAGLYADDATKLGFLAMEEHRAARMVVDVGVHSKGWTAERAATWFRENTLMGEGAIQCEVQRIVDWPGQVLGYVIGRDELRSLRGQAETGLGERFDLDRFHEMILTDGAVPPAVLRERTQRWIAEQKAASP